MSTCNIDCDILWKGQLATIMLEFLLLNLAYIYLGKQNREKHKRYSCNREFQ